MKRLLLFVGLLSAVIGISFHTTTANAAINTWQKGISIQSRSSTDFASSSFRQSVDNAAKDGVNYVTLVVSVHQDNINSNNVYSDGSTPTDSAIQSAANYLSSKGIGVAIAIHDDPYDGQWRAYVNASNPISWFASYQSMLDHYASIAQSSGVNELIIGTEMSTMTQSKYTNNWIAMIKSVRSLYSGSLTYSAQHEGYMSDAQSLGFWSYLDKIGISAYYSLNGATTEPAMESAWKNWDQQEISVLSAKYGKPIIFTEVGFVSKDGSTQDPGSGYSLNTGVNTTLQATAYDALFDYWQNSSEVQGMFLWDWSSDPNAGGSNDGNYTPQNKPAEAIMKKWYTTGASTGTGTTTPTSPATYTVTNAAAAAVTGTTTNSTITVSASTAVTDAIVDVEVYDPNGQRVNQTYVEHQSLSSNGSSYVVTWTPAVAGTYTIKAGVFTANWQSQLFWTNTAGTVTVTAPVTTAPVTTPTPPVTTPTPPVTTPTPPVTTPTPPVTLPTAISIWWPSNGSAVGGVQPFKAVINGRDSSTYDMFWQVDGGQLNAMSDNSNGGAHKESSVDISNWNWNASKQYVITFVAKDKSGNVLSQQSVTITVN